MTDVAEDRSEVPGDQGARTRPKVGPPKGGRPRAIPPQRAPEVNVHQSQPDPFTGCSGTTNTGRQNAPLCPFKWIGRHQKVMG
jgi:hypothetical protein